MFLMQSANTDHHKAIVIGSGVAGMATAIRLAVLGYTVTVYEKNNYPGGKLSAFTNQGYHFDAGPSLFTQPKNIEELFELAGEPIEEYFSCMQIPLACKYFYDNGKIINAHTDIGLLAGELNNVLGEKEEAVKNYLAESANVYKNVGTVFLNHSLHKRKTWFNKRIVKAITAVKYGHLFKTLHRHNLSKFTTPEAVQMFNRYATYNGSDPYQAPGMLSLIPHLEYNEGTYYPKGGMISITNALFRLAQKKGVQFVFDTPVKHIIHHEGKVKGVVVNNENIYSDTVISNMDIYFTYKHLLSDQHKARNVLKQERSSSALVFYWGIKRSFPELELHNIFFAKDYKAEFECLFKRKLMHTDPTIYINITSKIESSMAPLGCENWFVMVNAPANTGQDWETIKQTARKTIIDKLNQHLQTDLSDLIETEEILDPISIEEKTHSYMGSLYGTSSNSKWAAFLRHPNFSSTIEGLYFCGGSVHPGGGIPLCFKSAEIVSEMIESTIK